MNDTYETTKLPFYAIRSGRKNGFYTLATLTKVYNAQIGGMVWGYNYIKTLSTDKEKAIQKARDYIGDSNYNFNIDFDLNEWGTHWKEESNEWVNYEDHDNHVQRYYENKEYIVAADLPLSDEKQSFRGKIINHYRKTNDFGTQIKIWFLDDRGFVLNLSLPSRVSKLDVELKDFRFGFDAILNDDTWAIDDYILKHDNCNQLLNCAFVKRPTKIIF